MDARGAALHAREAKDPASSCASCHPDHAGTDFALVAWPEGSAERFDHRRAGWTLEGKHATTACEKCHRDGVPDWRRRRRCRRGGARRRLDGAGNQLLVVPPARRSAPEALGPKCESCHDSSGMEAGAEVRSRPEPLSADRQARRRGVRQVSPGAGASTSQPDANGKLMPQFKPLAFAECSACHADPHQGRLASKCSSCHVTQGFDVLDRRTSTTPRRAIRCSGSTARWPARRVTAGHGQAHAGVRHAAPTATPIVHRGEATLAGKLVDCAACHQVEGFSPATFTVAQHQATRVRARAASTRR